MNEEKDQNLSWNELWFEVIVPFAGLNAPDVIQLDEEVKIERIFKGNIFASALENARDVALQLPWPSNSDPPEKQNVYGLRYRIRRKNANSIEQDRRRDYMRETSRLVLDVQHAFVRSVILLQTDRLVKAGEFIVEIDPQGQRRMSSSQFSPTALGVHYVSAYFDSSYAQKLKLLFARLMKPYFIKDGLSIAVALDRLGSATSRDNQVDANLDLCIAAEILFQFGMSPASSGIAKTIKSRAEVFFGEGEFFLKDADVADVVRKSYEERNTTVHGREGISDERQETLLALNGRLREILKAAILIFVRAQPSLLCARESWKSRMAAKKRGEVLGPIEHEYRGSS